MINPLPSKHGLAHLPLSESGCYVTCGPLTRSGPFLLHGYGPRVSAWAHRFWPMWLGTESPLKSSRVTLMLSSLNIFFYNLNGVVWRWELIGGNVFFYFYIYIYNIFRIREWRIFIYWLGEIFICKTNSFGANNMKSEFHFTTILNLSCSLLYHFIEQLVWF